MTAFPPFGGLRLELRVTLLTDFDAPKALRIYRTVFSNGGADKAPAEKDSDRQAARRPITKCRIREITANRSNRWIRPPATWNTVKPPIHATNSTTNKIVQMLIGLLLCGFEGFGAER